MQFGQAEAKQRLVDVSEAKVVHWNVPILPKLRDRLAVPPVAVELSIPESEYLGQNVEIRVKKRIKHHQPYEMVRHG